MDKDSTESRSTRTNCFLKTELRGPRTWQKPNQKESLSTLLQEDKEVNVLTKKSIKNSTSFLKEDAVSMESTPSLLYEESKMIKVIDIHGVRIRPAVVRFDNAFDNQSYTETVSVQNISENSVNIRILPPRSWSFRVTPLARGHLLAPGLKVSRHLHYTCTKNGIIHSTLPIYINENIVELPLEACKGEAFVEIIPTFITFGRVDIGCKPVQKSLIIKNVSFCATKFLVDVGANELEINVRPLKGWIRPYSSVTVVIQLLALREGVHSSEIWITTDLSQIRVPVEVEACRRNFIVHHPNTISDFTLIDFPLTFFGCRRYQTVVVYNMAASSSAFVVLADFGSEGEEPFKEAKKGDRQQVKMFDVEPVEGRIRPFEETIFTFWFNPKVGEDEKIGQKSDINSDVRDYLCAIKLKRIQYDDVGTSSVSEYNKNTSSLRVNTVTCSGSGHLHNNLSVVPVLDKGLEEEEDNILSGSFLEDVSILLYLYGEAEVPSLSVTPDTLYFPKTPIGITIAKVVQLTNNTNQILAFQYIKMAFFEVLPDFQILAPRTSYDVSVKFHPRNIGNLKNNLTFDILAKKNATDMQDFHVVRRVTVRVFGEVESQKVVPKPKFNPGITPLITHEVGFLTDEVTFSSKVEKPRCAFTAAVKRGRPWHHTDSLVAFPNDRPLTLRPRPNDAMAKTIYKGLTRYIMPVDESQTYTPETLMNKKAHHNLFLKYIRGTAAQSVANDHCCKWKDSKMDPDPPLVFSQERELKLPQEVYIPLTFVQLYRIRIYPSLISFGSVTINKSCTQLLSIENANEFKINARLLPLSSGIIVQTLENFIIPETSEAKVILTFQRETLGKYSGTISCVINGFHSLDIAVVAEVVHRSLTITPDYVEIKVPDIPFADMCVPVAINNPLNIPVTYSWVIPEESPIKIEPITGVSPKRGTVWCGVFFEPETPNYKLHPIKLMVEGTTCPKLKTGVILPKTNVYFLEPVMNVGYIPVNVKTVKKFTIFNPDFSDAMFVVLNQEPIKGGTVKPSSGIVKAKSCHCLSLHLNLLSEKTLDFTIYMTLQNSMTIEMKVTGSVIYPEVVITPQYINLHRVPCNSVTRTTLEAVNKSKVRADVGFDMDEYPQFKVSLCKKYHEPGLTSNFALEPGAVQKFYLHFIPMDLASYEFHLPVVINNLFTCGRFDTKIGGQRRMINSMVRSKNVEERQISSEQSAKLVKSNNLVLVNVVVSKAHIVISDLELIFSSTPETKSFSIKNVGEQPIGVIIRSEDLQSIFDIHVKEDAVKDRSSLTSIIPSGNSIAYSVTFIASCPGVHVGYVYIHTSLEDHSCVYNILCLTGRIPFPCVITSSVDEIYFQPVPLNVEVSFIFHLNISHNLKNKETFISMEMNDHHADLFTVEYLEGNSVAGITNCSIPVKITFCSSFPVSLRKMITFKVEKYSECLVMMMATADNCLLTTHAFLNTHSPTQPTLNVLEDNLSFSVRENEIRSSPKQQLISQHVKQTVDSSSGGSSNVSIMSLRTVGLLYQTSKLRRSAAHSISVLEKERKPLQKSDIDLSIQLTDKEEKQPSVKDSFLVTEIITKEEEQIIFPMFPVDPMVSDNALYMNKTLNAVQQWVYEQVFCCSYNPVFGSHSFSSFSHLNKKDYGLSSGISQKNVFDALERICGRRIRQYFTPIDKLPEERTSKALFTFNLYRQLVEFMEAQGAFIAHIDPKYLMIYEEYCLYQNAIMATNKVEQLLSTESQFSGDSTPPKLLSSEKFFSFSVQCWLDLFLQIFKTLVFGPAVGIEYHIPHEGFGRLNGQSRDFEMNKFVYGEAEDILLSWLTHHYNSNRTVVWPKKSPPFRSVTNFDTDLEDGLVLTATTAVFCPFLNPIHFQNMYLYPTTISHAYHNTTCLCMAWDSIKLGFSVTPRDLVYPNTIKMLLLVTHLYKILPSYKPEATITFTATLNASEVQIVALENDDEATVTYHVEILPHASNFFLEDGQNSFALKRKSKRQITIQYMARNTNKAEAILLLCGACMPPKFGRNYVFKLVGYPIRLPVSSSFNIISPQNRPMDTEIIVESPHTLDFKANESYYYDLWVAYTEPQPENLNALPWAKEKKRKIPRRLFFIRDTLVVTENKMRFGSGTLNFKVCCFSQIVSHFWIIFRNKEVGDFIVKLQITPCGPEPSTSLHLTMNQDSKCGCTVELMHSCNRYATVHLPCRNLDQWAAVRTMFELTTTPEEKQFWAAYIESNIGLRLLQWMLDENKEKLNKELEVLFKKSKTYKITCLSKYVSCMPTLHIPDIRSKTSLPVQLHFNEATPSHVTVLKMISVDGYEIRNYNLYVTVNNKK